MTAYKKPTFFDRSIKSFSELSSASGDDLGLELYKLKLTALSTGLAHVDSSGNFTSSLLVNADVASDAAIAGTKVSPDFGAQNVATTGALAAGAATLTSVRATGLSTGLAHVDSSGNFTSSALVNADVDAAAAIAYSKLALTGSIVNADVSSSAAIAYSKLALTGEIVNADVSSSAAIAYSKLALAGSLVNADVAANAAIAGTKIAPNFGSQNVTTTGNISGAAGTFSGAVAVDSLAATGAITGASATLGSGSGSNVASIDGSGNASFGGTLAITGAATLSSTLSAGASTLASASITGGASVGTTLAVTGATTLSSTLSAGASTLASASITGAATVGGTLGVTGATTLASFSATSGSMSGALAMGANKITGLADPTSAQDAATKAYVDATAQGLDVKASCVVATVSNITLSGTQTIDGVAVVAGDRVLVKAQTDAATNGIYVVAAGAWSRASDADTSAKVTPGMFTFIEGGTVNADSGWVLVTDGPIVLGTTALAFSQFSGAGSIEAGDGLSKSGNTISVNVGPGIQIASDAVAVRLATTPGLTTSGDELAVLLEGSAPALSLAGGLHVVADATKALTIDSAAGLRVVADSTKALAIDSSAGLQVVADGNYGLTIDSSAGLRAKVDGTRAILNGSGQIDVAGVPAQFQIAGSAVSSAVTAANLGTLVDGAAGDAKALHSHSADAEYLTAASGLAAAQAAIVNASGEAATAGTTSAGAYMVGVVESIAAGSARIVRGGIAVGVLSGATAGDAYYVQADGTLGTSLPASGRCVMAGIARNATDLHVQVRDFGSILAA